MRGFFDAVGVTVCRWIVCLPKWIVTPIHGRIAHAILALAHTVLGGALLLEAQWLHAACVLVAAAMYHGLSRPGGE